MRFLLRNECSLKNTLRFIVSEVQRMWNIYLSDFYIRRSNLCICASEESTTTLA